MSDEKATDVRTTAAVDLVKAICASHDDERGQFSDAQRDTLIDALSSDPGTVSETAKRDEERLAKLEAQTHVLAEAVIAIAAPAVSIAPAVQAVKEEM